MPPVLSGPTHERIRAAREAAGLSREDLAELLGLSYKTIQNYETGATAPPMTRFGDVAAALGVTLADLMPGKIPSEAAGSSPPDQDSLPVVTPKRDQATEDPLNPPGPRAPARPAILFVLRSNNGPAVGWDVNSGRFVQVGEPGHLDVVPEAATADGAASSPAGGARTGSAVPASSAA